MSAATSTTWKSLAAGFAAGFVSTIVFAGVSHTAGIVLWALSLVYIFYESRETSTG
jgi:hypothetical protein